MNKSKLIVTIMASLIWGEVGRSDAFSNLDLAHQAYLKGDFSSMTLLLKGVLVENPPISVKQNALELISKAYEAGHGNDIKPDWKLPVGINTLKLIQRRVERVGNTHFSIKLSGNIPKRGVIEQLQLIKYPNQVVLDKQMKVGEYNEQVEDNPADGIYYELDGNNGEVPAADGLYLINISLTNGSKMNGWVIVSDLVSSRAPAVLEPKTNAVLHTGNPVLQMEDFISPEYKGFERRTQWLGIIEANDPNAVWHEVWTSYTDELPRMHLTVGKEPGAIGATELKDGKYKLYVAYKEERRFGDIRLGRQSITTVGFSVKK